MIERRIPTYYDEPEGLQCLQNSIAKSPVTTLHLSYFQQVTAFKKKTTKFDKKNSQFFLEHVKALPPKPDLIQSLQKSTSDTDNY